MTTKYIETLVTGGAGFVGAALSRKLQTLKLTNLIVLDRDIQRGEILQSLGITFVPGNASDTELISSIVREHKVTKIIHLAANSDIKNGSINCTPDFEDTLKTSIAIAEVITKLRIDLLLFASTSAVFGNRKTPILQNDTELKLPISNYGWSKLASEYALRSACHTSGTKMRLIRFPNVVGTDPTHGILLDFKQKLALNSQILQVLGNGLQTKPYMYLDDLIDILIDIFVNPHNFPYEELNIGPSDRISVREIVEILLEEKKLTPEVQYELSEGGWIGDVPNYQYSGELPTRFDKFKIRSSRQAIIDAVKGSW